MASERHVLVRFVHDKTLGQVPAEFIKNFKEQYESEKNYEVFWSPKSGETLDEFRKVQEKVLNIDDLREKAKPKEKLKYSKIPGFYYAKILAVKGVVEHLPGHYLAYIRRSNGQWELHNDMDTHVQHNPPIEVDIDPHLIVYTIT